MAQSRSGDQIIVKIDVQAVINQTADPLQTHLLNALLQQNEIGGPNTHFSCFRDVFLVDKPNDDGTLPQHPNYKGSYVFTREPMDLYFVNDAGNAEKLPLTDTDRLILQKNLANTAIDPLQSIYLQSLSDRLRTTFFSAITGIKHHANTQNNIRYGLQVDGQTYQLELSHNILRRESKEKDQHGKPRIVYEAYQPTSFYSAQYKADLFNTVGVLKPTANGLVTSNKHARVVKKEETPNMTNKEKKQRVKHFNKVERKMDHMHYKKPEMIDIPKERKAVVYSTMKQIKGENLLDYIEKNADAPGYNTTKVNIIEGVLKGLGDIHNKDLSHNDIKPANIHYDKETKKVEFVDFDETKGAHSKRKSPGTEGYVAPEIQRPGFEKMPIAPMNKKTDVYATGLVLISLWTGKITHEANAQEMLNSIKNDRARILFGKMIDPNPSNRPTIEKASEMFKAVKAEHELSLKESVSRLQGRRSNSMHFFKSSTVITRTPEPKSPTPEKTDGPRRKI